MNYQLISQLGILCCIGNVLLSFLFMLFSDNGKFKAYSWGLLGWFTAFLFAVSNYNNFS